MPFDMHYTFTDGTRIHAHRFYRESEHVTLYTTECGNTIAINKQPGNSCTVCRNVTPDHAI